MQVSKHAEQRLKERNGFNKKACERMAQKAWDEGISHSQTKGNLKKWVDGLYFREKRANNIRLYGDKAYIFCGDVRVNISGMEKRET